MGLGKLKNIGRVIGKALFEKLLLIEAMNKEFGSPIQCIWASRKTSRLSYVSISEPRNNKRSFEIPPNTVDVLLRDREHQSKGF